MAGSDPDDITFPRLLLKHAAERGNRPATREKDLGIWQTWTWTQVADEVRALACGLAAQGFRRGMHLAIIGDNRPRLYWSMIAAQALGGVPVPMYQDAPAVEFAYVLNDAEIVYAVAEDQEQVDKMLEARPQVPTLEHIYYDDGLGRRSPVLVRAVAGRRLHHQLPGIERDGDDRSARDRADVLFRAAEDLREPSDPGNDPYGRRERGEALALPPLYRHRPPL